MKEEILSDLDIVYDQKQHLEKLCWFSEYVFLLIFSLKALVSESMDS